MAVIIGTGGFWLHISADIPCYTDSAISVNVCGEYKHPHSQLSIHLPCKLIHTPSPMTLRRAAVASITLLTIKYGNYPPSLYFNWGGSISPVLCHSFISLSVLGRQIINHFFQCCLITGNVFLRAG